MPTATDPMILTPDVYLNHLPPDEIKQFEVARNVYIAVIGALACDVLSHISDDIKTIKQSRLSSASLITTACFVLTRIFAIVYMAFWVYISTTPVANCTGLIVATNVFCLLAMGVTSFLFLRRVQAVYHGNRFVHYTFALLWAGTSGIPVMLIPGTQAKYIPGTGYCTVYKAQRYVSIANIMPAVFDTLVFFAISYKIAFQHNREMEPELGWARSWFSTESLPVVTRAVLQGGQQYYLITFGFNILSGAYSFSPSVPPMHQALFAIPSVALSACMACHAHRILVAACYRDEVAPQMLSAFVAAGSDSTVSHAIVGAERGFLEHKRASLGS